MFFFLVLILITIIIVYAKLKYFTLSGPIPGKPPQFLLGNLVQTGLSSGRYLGEITKQFQDEYGDTFHLWIGLIHLICVCNPDDVQHVFTHRYIYDQGYLHARDKRCWKIYPNLFYPERFQSEDKDHHLYASIPFGGGHRQCIGRDLARFELKTIIVRLMQNVSFGDGGEKVNSGGHVQRLTTTPKHVGVTITFDKRANIDF